MDADLETLATALYVRIDDLLTSHPERVPWRPRVGIAPKLSDAELVTLAVVAALPGFTSWARWLLHSTSERWFRIWPSSPATTSGCASCHDIQLADRDAGPRHEPVARRRVAG